MIFLNTHFRTLRNILFSGRLHITQAQFHVDSNNKQNFGPVKSYSRGLESPALNDVKSFLRSKNIKAFSGPTCFKCENILPKPKALGRPKRSDDSLFSLYINKATGNFHCTVTGRTGTFEELQNFLERSTTNPAFEIPANTSNDHIEKIESLWNQSIPLCELNETVRKEILAKFGIDCLPLSDLEVNGIRLSEDGPHVIVPWFPSPSMLRSGKQSMRGFPIGVKVFSLGAQQSKEIDVKHFPAKTFYGMLGMTQVPRNSRTVVLTMNEFDAIAVNCGSFRYKAASLPYGITYLPLEVLPYLERFSEIILWFNNCQLSWEAARQFAKKLGEERCRLIRPTPDAPRPLEALSKNLDMDKVMSAAVSAEIKNIVSFADLRGFVKDELMNCDNVCGTKWLRFPKLTQKLKGHRRGELTVLTGPTGSGKTTFVSEYSLDLTMQGVPTLWGSFEIQNVRLIKTLMKQYARSKLENKIDDFETVAEEFQRLPFHFMTYNGAQTIKDVIHTMRQAAYVHDIQHIIIDNLQFMMGAVPKNNDRFMVQDILIGEFRNFATRENIHVTVVIHPRKEDAGMPLQISSIFGTAKATQEADNVLILQQITTAMEGSVFKNSYVEVVKNRYDGELGKVPLHFDKNSLCMSKQPALDGELAEAVRLVEDESAIKLNGGGIISEDEKTLKTKPEWLVKWQNSTGD